MKWMSKKVVVGLEVLGGYSAYIASLYGLNRFYDGDVPIYASGSIVGGIFASAIVGGIIEKVRDKRNYEVLRRKEIGRIMGSVLGHKINDESGLKL